MEIPTAEKTERQEQNRDLRAELYQELATQFSVSLNSNATLPSAAQEALIELLDSDAPTATDIIAAVSKNDPIVEDANNE